MDRVEALLEVLAVEVDQPRLIDAFVNHLLLYLGVLIEQLVASWRGEEGRDLALAVDERHARGRGNGPGVALAALVLEGVHVGYVADDHVALLEARPECDFAQVLELLAHLRVVENKALLEGEQ